MIHATKYRVIFFLGVLLACRPENGRIKLDSNGNPEIDKTIALVNYKTVDRASIARAIRTINECNPKIVAVSARFLEYRDPEGDSLLSQAIRFKKNVILASGGNFQRVLTTGDRLVRSQSRFTEGCLAEGLVHYGFKNDEIVSFEPYRSVGDEVVWSLPISVASYYDTSLADDFMYKFVGNTYYYIHFSRNIDSFQIFDIDNLDNLACETLADKIVLLGYLGPDDEDLLMIDSNDDKKMYGTVIQANIILNLLENAPADIDKGPLWHQLLY
jgi:hypothetical protein